MKENTEMKVSYKMRKSIERIEKKFPYLATEEAKKRRRYGVEYLESNRVGRGFYDYCLIIDQYAGGERFAVGHNGTIMRFF